MRMSKGQAGLFLALQRLGAFSWGSSGTTGAPFRSFPGITSALAAGRQHAQITFHETCTLWCLCSLCSPAQNCQICPQLLLGERCTNPQKQCYHALAEWEKQSQASRYLLTRLSWGSFYCLLGSLWRYRCIHCQDDKAPTSPSTKNKKSTFAEVHGSCHGDFQGVLSQAWPRLCYARISILLCHCLC